MKNVDVWKLVEEIESRLVPESRKEIEELISSINGTSINSNQELMEDVIAPLLGITSANNRKFTIELVQRVIDELKD